VIVWTLQNVVILIAVILLSAFAFQIVSIFVMIKKMLNEFRRDKK
jgi:hypothetical protein